MQIKVTPYLKTLLHHDAIAMQYALPNNSETKYNSLDPLAEDTHQPVKGLIHKYENRALIKVSYRCAAHCQFCTRIRQIGTADGDLNTNQLQDIINYIKQHPQITDVILSGGDPFYTPKETLWLLQQLKEIDSVKVIRIGTRLPVHNPISFASKLIQNVLHEIRIIATIKPVIILIHFEHPSELTTETIAVIQQLKTIGVTLLSQTVFLKDINDDVAILQQLFEKLYWHGVQPYYLYRCDYVKGLEHFIVDIEKEREIATDLRKKLSGIACPTYIVDVEGKGKIPVPLDFWEMTSIKTCTDFNNKDIEL